MPDPIQPAPSLPTDAAAQLFALSPDEALHQIRSNLKEVYNARKGALRHGDEAFGQNISDIVTGNKRLLATPSLECFKAIKRTLDHIPEGFLSPKLWNYSVLAPKVSLALMLAETQIKKIKDAQPATPKTKPIGMAPIPRKNL